MVSPNLRATCSLLLSKYPETMKDTSKWTLSLKGFLLQQIGSIISQLQSKDKKDCLALFLDNFLSTLSEIESLSVNVGWLKSRVTALRHLKKAGPSIHASLSLLRELRVEEFVDQKSKGSRISVTSACHFNHSTPRIYQKDFKWN